MKGLLDDRLYRLGWKTWVLQNIILLVPFISCIPVVSSMLYRYFVQMNLTHEINTILSAIFAFTLIVDLIPLSLITYSTYKYFKGMKGPFKLKEEFLIPLSGFVWIFSSILWRLPFFLFYGFDLGLTRYGLTLELEDNQFLFNIVYNHFIHIFQIIGAVALLLFLYLQGKYFKPIIDYNDDSDLSTLGVGVETFLGIFNVIGVLFLSFESIMDTLAGRTSIMDIIMDTNPTGILFVIGAIFKVFFVPLLVILTSRKMLNLINLRDPEENVTLTFKKKNDFPVNN